MTEINQKSTLENILKNDPHIKKALDERPELYDSLKGLHDKVYDEHKFAIKGYEAIDKYDKYLAVAETALRVPGPGLNMLAYAGIRTAELVGKGLFSLYYGAKTKDWKGVGKLAVMEAAETAAPFGEILNIAPAYKDTARRFLEKKVTEEFKKKYLLPQDINKEDKDYIPAAEYKPEIKYTPEMATIPIQPEVFPEIQPKEYDKAA